MDARMAQLAMLWNLTTRQVTLTIKQMHLRPFIQFRFQDAYELDMVFFSPSYGRRLAYLLKKKHHFSDGHHPGFENRPSVSGPMKVFQIRGQ